MPIKKHLQIFIILAATLFAFETHSQVGIRNNGAIMKISGDAYLKVSGGDFTNNSQNSTEPEIDSDGIIRLDGNWYNNSSSRVFINRDGSGKLLLNGSSNQTIDGSTATSFETLELNNSSGVSLAVNTSIDYELILTTGNVDLASNNLNLGESASVTGTFDANKMIIANGSGQLRKYIGGNISFTFPVGDDSGTPEYSPVTFTLNSNNGLSSAWIGVNLVDSKHPEDPSPSEYITRYWTLSASGITSPDYDVSFNYLDADIEGNEVDIFNAKYNGSTETLYDRVDNTNNKLVFSGLSSFSDFTGKAGVLEVTPSNSGNWSTEVGNTYSYTNVIIPNDIEITLQSTKASATVNNLTLDPLGSLTVDGTLDVTGDMVIKSSSTGTGSLIDASPSALTIQGISYINRYLGTNRTDHNWRYVSTPVDNSTAQVFDPQTSGNYVFWWDEPNSKYWEITANSDSLHILRGYAVGSSTNRTVTFTGDPNSGVLNDTLTRESTSEYEGFNLVGNPYPSSINWDTTGWNNSNISTTIWYRSDSSFATYNKDGNTGVNGGQKYIPAMQAFWVRVIDGQSWGKFEANNNVRTHERYEFYKKDNNQRNNVFRMVADKNGYTDEIAVAFIEEASNHYDNYDSEKMFFSSENYPQLYMLLEERKIVINGMKPLEGAEYEVPLGLRLPSEGEYTLKATNLTQFDAEVDVYLEDKVKNIQNDLREKSSYQFQSKETDVKERFVLKFSNNATDVSGLQGDEHIDLYSHDRKIFIDVDDEHYAVGGSDIQIINVLGQEVYNNRVSLNRGKNIIHPDIESGIYIIKLTNGRRSVSNRIYFGEKL